MKRHGRIIGLLVMLNIKSKVSVVEGFSAGAKIAKGTTWHREENEEVDS